MHGLDVGSIVVEGPFLLFAAVCAAAWVLTVRTSRVEVLGRWVVPASATGLICVLAIGAYSIAAGRRHEAERMASQMVAMADVFRAEIEMLGHEHVDTAGGEPVGSPGALAREAILAAQIRWLAATDSVADIYTVRREWMPSPATADAAGAGESAGAAESVADGGSGRWLHRLVVDSETDYNRNGIIDDDREGRTDPGEELELVGVERVFEGESRFVEEPTLDRWGYWVSSHSPLRDSHGKVEAILGVDYPAEAWLAALRSADIDVYLRTGLTAGALLLALSLVAAAKSRGIMALEHARTEGRQLSRELEFARRVERGILPSPSSAESVFQVAVGPSKQGVAEQFDRLLLADGREILIHASARRMGLAALVMGTIVRDMASRGEPASIARLDELAEAIARELGSAGELQAVSHLGVWLMDPARGALTLMPGRNLWIDGQAGTAPASPLRPEGGTLAVAISEREAVEGEARDPLEIALPPGATLTVLSATLYQRLRTDEDGDALARARDLCSRPWRSAEAAAAALREVVAPVGGRTGGSSRAGAPGTFYVIRRG